MICGDLRVTINASKKNNGKKKKTNQPKLKMVALPSYQLGLKNKNLFLLLAILIGSKDGHF